MIVTTFSINFDDDRGTPVTHRRTSYFHHAEEQQDLRRPRGGDGGAVGLRDRRARRADVSGGEAVRPRLPRQLADESAVRNAQR